MTARSSTVILLIHLIVSSHALNCLNNCPVTGASALPTVVPSDTCPTAVASSCQVVLNFDYRAEAYVATFSIASAATYTATIEARPSNYLISVVSYSCTDSDSCALDFAKKKLVELAARKYNLAGISTDITAILQASQQPVTTLVCADNDACVNGVCKIEFDTVSNTQKAKACEKAPATVGVTASGSSPSGSFEVRCDLPKCNTPETLSKAKAIFVKYTLTDADGRLVEFGKRNHGHAMVSSMILVVGLALLSSIVI